jgi:hypothetical protein
MKRGRKVDEKGAGQYAIPDAMTIKIQATSNSLPVSQFQRLNIFLARAMMMVIQTRI